ncbi:MAG TPA: GNAT family N-acetyltransferase [Arenibaculum sp.]|nr:GNAT family N-acetyltransferase [Arenibaculum sp.]
MADGTPPTGIRLRRMTPDDVGAAHALSQQVDWPHRPEDWQFIHRLGHGMVAEAGGAVLGTALWCPYGPDAAALGMVVVAPDRQGRGIGRRLTQAVLDDAGSRTVALNATEAGLPLYESLGFRPSGTIHQHQGVAPGIPLAPLREGERIRPIGRSDMPTLIDLDTKATGLPRSALLRALLDVSKGVALDRNGETVGFALVRRFGLGHAVGPVIARHVDGAKALIRYWAGLHAGMFVRIDVTGDSGLSDWAGQLGLARAKSVMTMARGRPIPRDGGFHAFAIVNQALG